MLPIFLERPSTAVSSLLSMVRYSIVDTVPEMNPVDEDNPFTPQMPPVAGSTSRRGRIPIYSCKHQEIKASNCNYFKGRVLSHDCARLGPLSSVFFEHDSRLFAERQLKFADCTVALDADGSTVVSYVWPFSHSMSLGSGTRIGWLCFDTEILGYIPAVFSLSGNDAAPASPVLLDTTSAACASRIAELRELAYAQCSPKLSNADRTSIVLDLCMEFPQLFGFHTH